MPFDTSTSFVAIITSPACKQAILETKTVSFKVGAANTELLKRFRSGTTSARSSVVCVLLFHDDVLLFYPRKCAV